MQQGREHFVTLTAGTRFPPRYKIVFVGKMLCRVTSDTLSPLPAGRSFRWGALLVLTEGETLQGLRPIQWRAGKEQRHRV